VSPYEGRPGNIFEIFQNGLIFLKFLFFKNIKKEKKRQGEGRLARSPRGSASGPAGRPVLSSRGGAASSRPNSKQLHADQSRALPQQPTDRGAAQQQVCFVN